MSLSSKTLLALGLVLFMLGQGARAELRIDITQGTAKAVPIAVVPFLDPPSGKPAIDVAKLIGSDLGRTGRFAPIPESDMLQKPTKGTEVDFGDWRILGTEVVIVGRVLDGSDGKYTIQFQVFDAFRGEQLLGYRLPTTRANLRMSVHRVSDMIYEQITGIPGAAATRVAYVNVQGPVENRPYRLLMTDSDGENARVIMESKEPIMSPSWSPDGRKLVYVSFENQNSQIYVQVLRTGARKRVSARKGVNSAPSWSPDGRM
ncbi:MAG: Tol-Pal system beta propeller repeat protein TolB, partial [Gammaproteobacteria bacterium]